MVFEKLKTALDEFGIKSKPRLSKPKTPFRPKILKKESLRSSKNDDLIMNRDKWVSSFEPSNILDTRNSLFWRLRNLKAWFKEQESYEDSRYIKSYSIKI